jgi:excisionase family DNA binding protein
MKTEFIDTRTAAEELQISEQHLRQLVRAKKIPHYRLSERILRFDLIEIRQFMRQMVSERSERA